VIVAGDGLRLISRNGHDRTPLFREPVMFTIRARAKIP
jgi:hypothetical protein